MTIFTFFHICYYAQPICPFETKIWGKDSPWKNNCHGIFYFHFKFCKIAENDIFVAISIQTLHTWPLTSLVVCNTCLITWQQVTWHTHAVGAGNWVSISLIIASSDGRQTAQLHYTLAHWHTLTHSLYINTLPDSTNTTWRWKCLILFGRKIAEWCASD